MKRLLEILLVSLLVIALPGMKAYAASTSNATQEISIDEKNPATVLFKIALCESGNRQFTDAGDIVRGSANRLDIGRFQINERWNGAEAKKLGYDLYTLEGNTGFAIYLYKKLGTKPWLWSKDCWDRPLKTVVKEKLSLSFL